MKQRLYLAYLPLISIYRIWFCLINLMLNSYNAWIVSIEIQNTLRRINITQYMYMYHLVAIWNKCAKKAWKWSLHTQFNDRMVRGVWISEDDSPRLSGGHQVFIIHGNGQQADYPEHISRHTTQTNIPGQLCTSDIFAMILQFAFRFW